MTRRNRAKSSSLFLLELILAILFFSIASAVCVQFFVKSHLLSQESRELEVSANEVSSVAELINASSSKRSAIDLICSEYPDTETSDTDEVSVYYDEDFSHSAQKDAVYTLKIAFTQEAYMLNARMSIQKLKDGKEIYSLDISHHLQRGLNHEYE